MKHFQIWILGILCLLFTACKASEEIIYMQNIIPDSSIAVSQNKGIEIQPKDMLSIMVSGKDPNITALLNLPRISMNTSAEIKGNTSGLAYTVDKNGEINFPLLGKLKVAGLTRWELQEKIKRELQDKHILNDAIVSVEFKNFKISILGEVAKPGSYNIEGDKVTILQALSLAGDLTIYGERSNVKVIREINGERTIYSLDLRSTDLFKSGGYFLKQNDVIYVQPNNVRAGQSTVKENNLKSVGLWISITSLLMSVGVLIVNIIK